MKHLPWKSVQIPEFKNNLTSSKAKQQLKTDRFGTCTYCSSILRMGPSVYIDIH